jgi:hypothetical protein
MHAPWSVTDNGERRFDVWTESSLSARNDADSHCKLSISLIRVANLLAQLNVNKSVLTAVYTNSTAVR